MTWKFDGDLRNHRAPPLYYVKLYGSFQSHRWIRNGVTVRKHQILGQNQQFFVPCDLEIWQMTLKNNRAPLLCYLKFYVSFHSHLWNQNEVRSGNTKFGSKSAIFCPVWPWNFTDDLEKTIGHLFYATSSLVHHFIAICGFKMELQSGNAQFGSKLAIFFPCDIEIWRMTLKNNRAPLLCYFKLCASFHSHLWIQNGVTVQKRQIWVKIGDFFVLCDLEIWPLPWKTIRHHFYATSSFVHHSIAISEFKLKLQSGNG